MSDYGYYGNGSNSGNSGNSNSNGYSSSSDNSYSQNTGSTNNGYGQGTGAANNTYGSNSYSNYNYGASGYNAYGQNGYNSYNQGNPYKQAAPKKPRKEHPTLKKAGKLVAAGLIFGLCASLMFTGTNYVTSKVTGKNTAATAKTLTKSSDSVGTTSTSTASTVSDVSDIVDNVNPAIVQVTNVSLDIYQTWFGQMVPQESTSAGSGIIISQDDDYIYIATNNHVVEGARELTITFCDNKAVSAQVQGTNEASDLAVVKVAVKDLDSSTLSAIKVATIGDSSDLKVGEGTVVMGNAMGYGISVTTGVVSALDRDVQVQSETTGETVTYSGLIQTNAAVNPGNSGGALLNMKGEVIGIVSAKYVDTQAEGLGYAIPITKAQTILEKLMNGQTVTDADVAGSDGGSSDSASAGAGKTAQTAYLGIYGVDITSDMASSYNMPTGVYVSKVASGSGAEAAGIQKRDIITAVDGTAVSSMSDMQSYLTGKNPGDTVKLTVAVYSQNYATQDVDVTLGEKPADTTSQQ